MNGVKIAALSTSMMTPAERAAGRFMRAPDHPAADESSGGADNTGGNSGDSTNAGQQADNTSQDDDLKTFWDDKPADPKDDESTEDDTATQSQALGAELGGIIKSYKAPEVFTKENADKIADGDLSGINQALNEHAQSIMQHQMVVTAKLLGGVIDRLSADFDKRIQTAFGNKDSEVTLESHFPLAKDPVMRPVVERVWNQALKNSKGNKEDAIRVTRGMLQAMGSKTSIREAADDPTAGINTPAARSLVQDLLARD